MGFVERRRLTAQARTRFLTMLTSAALIRLLGRFACPCLTLDTLALACRQVDMQHGAVPPAHSTPPRTNLAVWQAARIRCRALRRTWASTTKTKHPPPSSGLTATLASSLALPALFPTHPSRSTKRRALLPLFPLCPASGHGTAQGRVRSAQGHGCRTHFGSTFCSRCHVLGVG